MARKIFKGVRNNQRSCTKSVEEERLIAELKEISSYDEKRNLIAKIYGIPVEEVDSIFFKNSEIFTDEATEDIGIERVGCPHYNMVTLSCNNNHSSSSTSCTVLCTRTMVCEGYDGSDCSYTPEMIMQEINHTWSEGWCGQTCRTCGNIELFHAPGGCYYCR